MTRLTTSGQSNPVSSMFTETRICGNSSLRKRRISVGASSVSCSPMPETTKSAYRVKSGVLYQQMRGRGTRKAEHIKKSQFTIFDFVGNCDFHDDEDPLPGGPILVKPGEAKPSKPRRLLTLDLHDEIDPTTREWIVYEADGTVRASTPDEVRSERLGVRFEAFVGSLELTAAQERLARIIGEQIRHNAASMESFDAWRFTRPPFSLQERSQRAPAVFGGAEALDAFLAGLNAAVFGSGDEDGQEHDRPARGLDA
jgi:type I restriction enzyme, R subunit